MPDSAEVVPRRFGRASRAGLAALVVWGTACGGGAPSSVPSPSPHAAAEPPAAARAVACPVALTDLPDVAERATWLIEGSELGREEGRWVSGPGETAELRLERRDDEGHSVTTMRVACSAGALVIPQVRTPTVELRFEPPLPLLPATAGLTEASGTVAIVEDDVERPGTWRLALDAATGETPSAGPGAGASIRSVRSALVLEVEGETVTWATESAWIVSARRLFPLWRQQTVEQAGQARQDRVDLARVDPSLP